MYVIEEKHQQSYRECGVSFVIFSYKVLEKKIFTIRDTSIRHQGVELHWPAVSPSSHQVEHSHESIQKANKYTLINTEGRCIPDVQYYCTHPPAPLSTISSTAWSPIAISHAVPAPPPPPARRNEPTPTPTPPPPVVPALPAALPSLCHCGESVD